MAGEYIDGAAGDRADLSADPAAEIESGASSGLKRWSKNRRCSIPCLKSMGRGLGSILREKVEVVEGDVTQAALGLDAEDGAAAAEES